MFTVHYDESVMAFVRPFEASDNGNPNVDVFQTKKEAIARAKGYMRDNIQALREQIKVTGTEKTRAGW